MPAEAVAVRFGRSYEFTAAHRLNTAAFSAEQNREMYGKCNNPAGHGHNYRFSVVVQGHPDPATGMVINMAVLDAIAAQVLEDFNYKHLDLEVADFADRTSTAENIVAALWKRFASALQAHPQVELYQINLSETRNNQSKMTRVPD